MAELPGEVSLEISRVAEAVDARIIGKIMLTCKYIRVLIDSELRRIHEASKSKVEAEYTPVLPPFRVNKKLHKWRFRLPFGQTTIHASRKRAESSHSDLGSSGRTRGLKLITKLLQARHLSKDTMY